MPGDAPEFRTTETDNQGRIRLGTEYANKRVTVAIVNVDPDRPDEDELATAYQDAAENATQLAADWEDASTDAWNALDE